MIKLEGNNFGTIFKVTFRYAHQTRQKTTVSKNKIQGYSPFRRITPDRQKLEHPLCETAWRSTPLEELNLAAKN